MVAFIHHRVLTYIFHNFETTLLRTFHKVFNTSWVSHISCYLHSTNVLKIELDAQEKGGRKRSKKLKFESYFEAYRQKPPKQIESKLFNKDHHKNSSSATSLLRTVHNMLAIWKFRYNKTMSSQGTWLGGKDTLLCV